MKRFTVIIYLLFGSLVPTNQQINYGKAEIQKKWYNDGKGHLKWSFGCSFPYGGLLTTDVDKIKNKTSSACPNICYNNYRCTHFIYSNGYCYLKSFKFIDTDPTKATVYDNPGGLCGFVVERPDVVKNWLLGDNGKTRWSTECDYPNAITYNIYNAIKVMMNGNNCAAYCLSIKHCTHFTWNLKTCWVKDFRGARIVQTKDELVPICGFIPNRQDVAIKRITRTTVAPKGKNSTGSYRNTTSKAFVSTLIPSTKTPQQKKITKSTIAPFKTETMTSKKKI